MPVALQPASDDLVADDLDVLRPGPTQGHHEEPCLVDLAGAEVDLGCFTRLELEAQSLSIGSRASASLGRGQVAQLNIVESCRCGCCGMALKMAFTDLWQGTIICWLAEWRQCAGDSANFG
jgi:hypothetical protein